MLSERLSIPIDTRRLRSFDGTEIAYHTTRAARPDAPWIALANGLGATPQLWRRQLAYLGDRFRFITWDYRGLRGSSRPPASDDAYSVARHARDLDAVLASAGVARSALVGWSAGAQVLLEALPLLGRRATSLVLVNGTSARPLDARATLLPWLRLVLRARRILPVGRGPVGRRLAAAWLTRLGLVGRSADEATVAELTAAVAELDRDALLRNLRAWGEHDAEAHLGAIDVPTLVLAGDRDPLVPREISQQMARRIPKAELLVVRGGAHCLPLEFPELVSLRLERFYRAPA